ncbi:MAG: acetate kinase [Lachnospiraceae bacterium]|nr:acetate kinase [Lachnospiraceae bacterium]
MKILVINCGSSSLKYQLIDSETEHYLAKGLCERIGIDGVLNHSVPGKDKFVDESPLPTHKDAVSAVLKILTDPEKGVISSLEEIDAVGHRVVHGGEYFSKAVLVSDDVIEKIGLCSDLAPLHNPANLIGINACRELMPNTPMSVVFDTAFHQTMPRKAYLYGIPYSYYEEYGIRRYGFHGTSHNYVSHRVAKLMGRPIEDLKIIVCHLGNGSSISAVDGGKCVDTSMGMTPLEGMIMGTRSGDLDPAIVQYIAKKENMSIDQVLDVLNKKSGLLGISGTSSDFRDILSASEQGDERAKAAFEAFAYRIVKYIGSYVAAMNGVDAIAFTAGIGENNSLIRETVLSSLAYLGVKVDPEKNALRGDEVMISTEDSVVKAFAVPTNEELAIAQETVALLQNA